MTRSTPHRSSRLAVHVPGVLAALVVLACLLYLGVRYLLWPNLDTWRPELLAQIEQSLGVPVSADRLEPAWEGLHPSLAITGLAVLGPDGQRRLTVPSAYARVSWRSLAMGRPRLAALRLSSLDVTVERLASGALRVAGFELGSGGDPLRLLDWLLSQGDLLVDEATVRLLHHASPREPKVIAGLRVHLHSTGRRHQASLSIERPGELAADARLVADVIRPAFSRPADWRRWSGELHLGGTALDLAVAARLWSEFASASTPLAGAAPAGRLDQLGWLRFVDGRIVDGLLKARADGPELDLPHGRLALRDLSGEVRVDHLGDGGLLLRLDRLQLVDRAGVTVAGAGQQQLELDPDGLPRSARLRLQPVQAAAALALARRLPLAPDLMRQLRPLQISGSVTEAGVRWQRGVGGDGDLEVGANFERLSFAVRSPAGSTGIRAPGFANLSGRLQATAGEGSIRFSGRQGAALSFPGVFAEPQLRFDRIDGAASWTVDPRRGDGWLQVAVDRLDFSNADAAGTVSGSYRTGGRARGVVDLAGSLSRGDGTRVARYLPLAVPAPVREWTARALVRGRVDGADFVLRGDLADFPFRDPAAGAFRVAAQVSDVVLDYAPQWPGIAAIRGELAFERAGMTVRAGSGEVFGTRLADVRAALDDLSDGSLTVEGSGTGPADDLLRFLAGSPLAGTVGGFTRDAGIDGDSRLDLKLVLPLRDLGRVRASGAITLGGNRVTVDRTLPTFEGVSGRVEFTEQGLTLRRLQATLLGGPLQVEGRTVGPGQMRIDASGSIGADGMRSVVDNALTRRLQGRADYRARIDVDRRASTLTLESDLVGMSSSLPLPFTKRADERWPLKVRSTPRRPAGLDQRPVGDRLDVRVGDEIALAVERERDHATERMRIRRATFALDAEPVLRDAGLAVLLHAGSIDFDAWRAVLSDEELGRMRRGPLADSAAGFALVPDIVSVVAADVRIGGKDLRDVVFGATRHDGYWRANVSAREINGHFYWLDAAPGQQIGTLSARFTRLALPRASEGELESALTAPPTLLPALDIAAEELVVGNRTLGSLSVRATNGGTAANPVWKLDRLAIVSPEARFDATGSWAFGRRAAGEAAGAPTPVPRGAGAGAAGGRATELDFKLAVSDSGRLLGRFGLVDVLRGGSGTLTGAVRWQGSPIAIDYGTLDGSMNVQLGRGQFVKADPGIAKLIGVLNLQSLPKRLTLDFRDVFSEGFAFDEITGDVSIGRGIARTDDFRMKGLQAEVRIRGEADLQRETQTLQVEVQPQLDAGLAALAYGAIVNPVVGLGSFAAQYVLRKPLQQALGYEVDVTGPWSDPAVSERIRPLQPSRMPESP
jgi:uncharacterized protein (TIGR02099 family)